MAMDNPLEVRKLIQELLALEEEARRDCRSPENEREAELVPAASIYNLPPPQLHGLAYPRLVVVSEDNIVFRQAKIDRHAIAAIAFHLPGNDVRTVLLPVNAM